jgi:hypothetical protein
MTESQIQSAIRLRLGGRPDVRLFRNHVGTVRDDSGRVHTFGLQKGSADLIGWVTVNGAAIFLSVEVKSATGRTRPEQTAWAAAVNKMGGIAFIARSPEDAEQQLHDNIRRLHQIQKQDSKGCRF